MRGPYPVQHVTHVQKTLDYIESHLKAPVTLEALARLAAFSPHHYHRIFQALVGEPVMEYVRRRRLSEAGREMLADPTKRMLDLALEYQFSSQEAFIRAFRKCFGMTPGEFRRQGLAVPLWEPARVQGGPSEARRPVRRQRRPVFHRIHAAFLQVSNLKQSTEWYTDRLGFERMHHWGGGVDFRVFNDETMLTLVQAERVQPAHFIDFRAHDLEGTHSLLRQRGVSVSEIIDEGVIKTFCFTDPDANQFNVWYEAGDQVDAPRSAQLFDRVDGVLVKVRNLERSVKWYAQVLSLTLLCNWGHGADFAVGLGQTLLTLIEQPDMHPQGWIDERTESPVFHFRSFNIERTRALLTNRGVEVTPITDYGPVRCFQIADPDGNRFGVCYEKPNSPFYNR